MADMTASLQDAWLVVGQYVLGVLGLLLVVLIGWLVSKAAQWVVVLILKALRFDEGAEKVGFSSVLKKAEFKLEASELVGIVIYWALILLTLIFAVNLFSHPIATMVDSILTYIVIEVGSAIFILVLTSVLASFISNAILIGGKIVDLPSTRPLSKVIYYIVIIFGFMVAIDQLGVDVQEIGKHLDVLVGAVGLALAIAFGLGCKDLVAGFFTNIFKGKEK